MTQSRAAGAQSGPFPDGIKLRPAPPGPAVTYATTEDEAAALGSDCQRRGHCCKMGSGVAREDELPAIADFLSVPLDQLKAESLERTTRFGTAHWRFRTRKEGKPYGPCVFYRDDENSCAIHAVKPLYCRAGVCNSNGPALMQWYNAHYFLNTDDPASIREYATTCQFNPPIPGARPEDLVPRGILAQVLDFKDLRKRPPLHDPSNDPE